MKLYDSLSRSLKPIPFDHAPISIYVCGVTPYDTTHLGHAYTYLTFDALIRYLESQGNPVRYVQNITDIDDDILKRASEEGVAWDELAEHESARFLDDLQALNIRMPDVLPRATQETEMMIEIAQALLDQGLAYEREGNVYYHVASDPDFGVLSGYDYPTMLATANERGNHPDDPLKKDPLDFVLWQAAQPGEPTWPSPWGPGRPGWHIECSAMSMRYLGPTIDIHGGGADLLFPHHECEIAQSEHYSGQEPFVRIWVHVGMVQMNGDKMSKSLKNMVFIRNLLERYRADDVRAYLLGYHYRSGFEWDEAALAHAAERTATWRQALNHEPAGHDDRQAAALEALFHSAIHEDLNTPAAINVLDELADGILIDQLGPHAQETLRTLGESLGFTL